MYERLGFEWASTLLAFLSLLFVPIPIWWFYKGRALRKKSPFARYDVSRLFLIDCRADASAVNISTRTRTRLTEVFNTHETFLPWLAIEIILQGSRDAALWADLSSVLVPPISSILPVCHHGMISYVARSKSCIQSVMKTALALTAKNRYAHVIVSSMADHWKLCFSK